MRGTSILHNAFLCRHILATIECGVCHEQQSITEKGFLISLKSYVFYLHLCAETYLRTNLHLWSTQSKGIQAHFPKPSDFIYSFLASLLPETTNFRNCHNFLCHVCLCCHLFILRISNL